MSLTKLTLDEQGWRAIARELAQTLEQVDRIHAESLERLRKSNHEGEREAMAAIMFFEAAQVPAAPPAGGAKRRRAPRSRARA